MSAPQAFPSPPSNIVIAASGPPECRLARFGLTAPKPLVASFNRRSGLDAASAPADAGFLAVTRGRDLIELYRELLSGDLVAGTLVVDDLTILGERIGDAFAQLSRHDARRRSRAAFAEIVRGAGSLPCSTVFLARTRPVYADAGSVIAGRPVGPEDTATIGLGPDLDVNIGYDVDLALIFSLDPNSLEEYARVTKSAFDRLPVGTVIAHPTFERIAAAIAYGPAIVAEGQTTAARSRERVKALSGAA
jgi:hypothetical protein